MKKIAVKMFVLAALGAAYTFASSAATTCPAGTHLCCIYTQTQAICSCYTGTNHVCPL